MDPLYGAAGAKCPTAKTPRRGYCRPGGFRPGGRWFCRARPHELELAPLGLLFEHAEARPLERAQHLVDPVVGAPELGRLARFEFLQRAQAAGDLRLVRRLGIAGVGHALQLRDHPDALLLITPPGILQRLEARDELCVLRL